MLPTAIPYDITAAIFHELQDDRPALLNCSTVCRAFAVISQTQLFRSICLSSSKKSLLCPKLYRLLTHSSHIAPLIRHLTIWAGWRRFTEGTVLKPVSWVFTEPTLAPLLSMLSDLKSLDIDSSTFTLDWYKLPPDLQSSLLRLFQTPTLTSIDLKCMSMPGSVFAQAAQLENLHLHECVVDCSEAALSPLDDRSSDSASGTALSTTTRKPTIKSFMGVKGCGKISRTEGLTTVVDFTRLRELALRGFDIDTVKNAGNLMRECPSSLEVLRWEVSMGSVDNETNAHLSCLNLPPSLRVLEVTFSDWHPHLDHQVGNWDILAWVVHVLKNHALQHGTVPSNFEELSFKFVAMFHQAARFYDLVSLKAWEELDGLLTSSNAFGNFRRATFTLAVKFQAFSEGDMNKQWIIPLTKRLARLHARQALFLSAGSLHTGTDAEFWRGIGATPV
ncbi:hypothetical protein Hypma_002282 [Hypsizygus marmoreus]|uniref:F-box domain-containing protein n=1 Tax=Hypsizygus marmoreus TaxID=39966 RepID=A0A369K2V4_HYPMA|nr:hypothetical protein Hypma_002282 [Hypsizygus marmoreus]